MFYYLITDEDIEMEGLNNVPKITQMVSDKTVI